MLNKLKSIFIKGLLTVLPIAITIYLLVWLISLFGDSVNHILKALVPSLANTGLSFVIGIVVIFVIGLLVNMWIGQQLKSWVDKLLNRIPVVSDIYTSIKSLSDYLGGNSQLKSADQVAMVNFAGVEVIGLVTRSDMQGAPKGMATSKDTVAVYLPMSYQVGGYTVYVAKKAIRPIEMKKKDALRWTLMAGVEQ